MPFKMSTAVRNARLDAIENVIGASAILRLRSGPPPTNVSDPDTGTVIAEMGLPADWMAPASGGQKAKSGTWQDPAANNAGTVGHFRIYALDGVTAHLQGTVTVTGGGGDMTLDNVNLNVGQSCTITTFTIIDGNG